MKELKEKMNAIIVTGGKQYKVAEGDVLFIEKLEQEDGDVVKFEQVLAIIDGEEATFGAPVVGGYLMGCEVSVKNIRVVLAAKDAELDTAVIRERIRMSYV
jgi:ribosomal protein L21